MLTKKIYLLLFYLVMLNSGLFGTETYIKTTTYNQAHWRIDAFVLMGTEGIAHWSNYSNLSWYIGVGGAHDVSESATISACEAAFAQWQNVSTADITFNTCSDTTSRRWGWDGYNVLYWAEEDDEEYGQYGPLDEGILAMTILTVNPSNEIIDADIVFNGRDRIWTTDDYDIIIDIQSVAAHEIGHFIGLGHTINSYGATMYAFYSEGSTAWRTLELDDRVGASFLYRGRLIRSSYTIPAGVYEWGLELIYGRRNYLGSGVYSFKNGSTFKIYGKLNGTGTIETPISIDFISPSSNGIIVYPNGEVHLDKCGIRNATFGLEFKNGALGTIKNSSFENNTYGIYISGAEPTIESNTISSNSYGIYFNQGGGTINHCNITDCNNGIYISSAAPTIQSCTISDNQYGIKIYSSYSSSWSAEDITNNYLTGNTAYGVYLYNSSPTLIGNIISNNYQGLVNWYSSNPILSDNYFNGNSGYGIACYGSASPSAYYNSTYSIGGNNRIQYNGNRGIVITGSSAPDFGSPNGYNSIFSNTGYEIDNSTGSYIFARNNYWGNPNGPQGGDINGLVYYVPYLEDDPNPDRIVSGDYLTIQKTSSGFPPVLEQAVIEMANNNHEKATELLKLFILEEKDSYYGGIAGVLLIKNLDFYMDGRNCINEIENLLKYEINKEARFELLTGLSNVVLKTEDKNGALTFIEDLKDFELTTEQRNRVLFQKAFTNIYGLNNLETGLAYLQEIVNRNSINSLDYQLAMEEINYLNQIYDLMPKPGDDDDNIESVKATTLASNYPNPFNPTTTITYTLKEKSNVYLSVYDILGRELEVLVDGIQEAGKYSAQFKASKYASGVYIYKLNINGKSFVKKMLMMM